MDMEKRLRKFEVTVFNPPVDYEYLKKELANGLDINAFETPILFAAKDYESTIFLLENGADPNKFLGWKNINDRDNMSSGFQILSYNKYKKKKSIIK